MVEVRSIDLDGITVDQLTIKQPVDMTFMLKGLPDGRCACPHFGVVTKGGFTVRYADGHEDSRPCRRLVPHATGSRPDLRGRHRTAAVQPDRPAQGHRRGDPAQPAGAATDLRAGAAYSLARREYCALGGSRGTGPGSGSRWTARSASPSSSPPCRLGSISASASRWSTCCGSAIIALRLADRLGLADDERSVVYYAALLVNVGCHSDAHEQAKWFGDDIAVKADEIRARRAQPARRGRRCSSSSAPATRRCTGSGSVSSSCCAVIARSTA